MSQTPTSPTLGQRFWNWLVSPETPGATTYGGTSPIAGTGTPNQSGQVIPPGSPDQWDIPGTTSDREPGWWDYYGDNYRDEFNEQAETIGGAIGSTVGTIGGGIGRGIWSGFKAAPIVWISLALVLIVVLFPWQSLATAKAAGSAVKDAAAGYIPPARSKRDAKGRFV